MSPHRRRGCRSIRTSICFGIFRATQRLPVIGSSDSRRIQPSSALSHRSPRLGRRERRRCSSSCIGESAVPTPEPVDSGFLRHPFGVVDNRSRMNANKLLRWIFLGLAASSIAASSIAWAAAPTPAQCTEILQRGLEDKNPDTRKQAVAALSLAASTGPLATRLIQMLEDKDVEVRQAAVASLAEVKTPVATAAL